MNKESLYNLGLKAKNGDGVALLKIIDRKKALIEKYSCGDDDCKQYIYERLVKGIKKSYKF